ncbi:hypothetical protein ABGB16_11885 [Micromonospora sp. B11E3]|uniref:hypothetical protein n=1 Tax=Micromonospora sp. B11E3 TaxID=3153562 RepID=UPI00325DE992
MTGLETEVEPMIAHCPSTGFGGAEAVAEAILYAGYPLHARHRSRSRARRWSGVLVPPDWAATRGPVDGAGAGPAESSWQLTQCLTDAPDGAVVRIGLRFLHLQRGSVETRDADGACRPVGGFDAGGRTQFGFDEAVPRGFEIEASVADLRRGRRLDVRVPGGEDVEPLVDGRRGAVGRVVRRRWPLSASVSVWVVPCRTPWRLLRLAVRVVNTSRTTPADGPGGAPLRCCLLATHTLIAVDRGRFLSLLDPPPWAASAAWECRNVHTFPVLAGEPGRSDVLLSSPTVLTDHPRPRAAATVDRGDARAPKGVERSRGAARAPEPVRREGGAAWWGPEADTTPWWERGADATVAPETERVLVAGIPLSRGSRVRLRPRRRDSDAYDLFLDGRTGRVEQVLLGADGSRFLAVRLDDDPGVDPHHWYGHPRHFRPEEVEPLGGEVGAR